jgi:hypothetical protein
MLVRGVVADARSPGKFAQRKLKALGFPKDFQGGPDDRSAQVAMVVGALVGLGPRHRWQTIESAPYLTRHVGDVNILHISHSPIADAAM